MDTRAKKKHAVSGCSARECAKAHSLKQKAPPIPSRLRGRGVEVSKTLFYILVRESCIKHSLQFQVLQGEIWGIRSQKR